MAFGQALEGWQVWYQAGPSWEIVPTAGIITEKVLPLVFTLQAIQGVDP